MIRAKVLCRKYSERLWKPDLKATFSDVCLVKTELKSNDLRIQVFVLGWNRDRIKANEDLQPRTKPVETHYKNTYFLHLPWQKCLQSQIKRPFSPSHISMLFTVTEEMHTWAVKPKQHCTRGGEGEGEFVPFGHEGCMARRTALKCPSSFVRGRRLFLWWFWKEPFSMAPQREVLKFSWTLRTRKNLLFL